MKEFNSSAVVDSALSEILSEVSTKCPINVFTYAPRLNILYYALFELAPAHRLEQLKNEIIECELSYLKLRPYENYKDLKMSPELLISMYADIAHVLALLKLESIDRCDFVVKNFICADYLEKNLSLLLDGGLVSEEIKQTFDMDIKNAFFNFCFATGYVVRTDFKHDPIFSDIASKSVIELRQIISEGTMLTADLKKMLNDRV